MNYGYQSLSNENKLDLKEEDEFNRYFIQLYEFVATAVSLRGLNVLEVGCGRGGGSDYIQRYHQTNEMTGLDYSKNAIRFCNNKFHSTGLKFVEGDAENLPFESACLDAVINVESSHCYANVPKFVEEVTRVLKPGGYFSFADFRDKEFLDDLEKSLLSSGLSLVKKTNISSEVYCALDQFSDAKGERFSKMFGTWLKNPLSEFAGMKGSAMHTDLSNGNTLYCHYLLQKTEEH